MRSRFLGSILLIIGTSIGGGMLALPIANAATGFVASSFFLLLCWVLMTLGAFFILEVNLYLPPGTNMISMAAATLGGPGIAVAWFSYLFLLYTLLAAYISGGGDVLRGLLLKLGIYAPDWVCSSSFTLLFAMIVYGGIRRVDLVNRGLMFVKLGTYILLIGLITPYTRAEHFKGGEAKHIFSTFMILITSYGFAIIVPNLREYFQDNITLLKKALLIGSIIPLFCYVAWDAIIMGTLPAHGKSGLIQLATAPHPTSTLAHLLSLTIHNRFINSLFNLFTSICMLTAFLGVSLCLISFLGDGLKLSNQGKEGRLLFLLTFIPPLLIVIFYPGAYLYALNYAGFFCVILLLLLPALMSYAGRSKFSRYFVVPGGHFTQWAMLISASALLIIAVIKLLL